HSESSQPTRSSRWKAVRRDPGFTLKTPRETCSMRRAMPKPCIGSRLSALRISMSSVPWIRSRFGCCMGCLEDKPLTSWLSRYDYLKRSTSEFWRAGPADVIASGSRSLDGRGIAALFRPTGQAYPNLLLRSFCNGQLQYGRLDDDIGYLRILSFD